MIPLNPQIEPRSEPTSNLRSDETHRRITLIFGKDSKLRKERMKDYT
ncbi:hypothetical protein COLO4_16069 [Corchorus olitorius]|uniref:Uncharacterized protein n=1 Tax=Corchorus olitorius TaxID=93759 RepID=A0A1R3JK00_9ROSI|nr:hypothetical protein COLO4_16069 [Corchorus olitorius]